MTSEPITVNEVRSFFDRFEKLESTWTEFRIEQFKTGFSRVAAAMQALQGMRGAVERVTAPRHNVFRILGRECDEDRTHTPMLADLLDPSGSHGQGHLFLREFLAQCQREPEFPLPHGDVEAERWFVDTQRVTAFGNLDMVISCPGLRTVVVIENKVYAPEQEDQLLRYSDWLATRTQAYGVQALVYLTPNGHASKTAHGRPYFRLSYRDDIADMLTRARPHIQAESVRATVSQYLALIQSL